MAAGQLVTLLDGSQVDSASEAWRHESEARAIAALRPLASRRVWLEDVERKRGKAAADRLRATMAALWDAKASQGPVNR